ncbi:MAG: hypothetical protein HC819_25140 [Cyclobacteriaceae bacterium]|nr:hypothetical protein [Cyclobacteriaceae bacterium]
MMFTLCIGELLAQTSYYYSGKRKIYVQTNPSRQIVRISKNSNAQQVALQLKAGFELSEVRETQIGGG